MIDEWQFFLALLALVPSLYFTMKFIVWFAEKVEDKK
tara:strand:+ start:668 stop:778 length:111 start_codon:yes stop_codon:yes gene_type:complete